MNELLRVAFGVVVLLIGIYIGRRKQLSEQILESQKEVSRLAWDLANFFGTHRDEEYDPVYPKAKAQEVIDLLSGINCFAARDLIEIAEMWLDSGSIPEMVMGDEFRYRSQLIADVCEAFRRKQRA